MKRNYLKYDELKKLHDILFKESLHYINADLVSTINHPLKIWDNEITNKSFVKNEQFVDTLYQYAYPFCTLSDILSFFITRGTMYEQKHKEVVSLLKEFEKNNVSCMSNLIGVATKFVGSYLTENKKDFLIKTLMGFAKDHPEQITRSLPDIIMNYLGFKDKKQEYYMNLTYLNEFLSPGEKLRIEKEIMLTDYTKESKVKLIERMKKPLKKMPLKNDCERFGSLEINYFCQDITDSQLKNYLKVMFIQTVIDDFSHQDREFNFITSWHDNMCFTSKNNHLLDNIEKFKNKIEEKKYFFKERFDPNVKYLEFKRETKSTIDMILLDLKIQDTVSVKNENEKKLKI